MNFLYKIIVALVLLSSLPLQAASLKWVAVFSKNTGYTDQAYDTRGDWRELMESVRQRKGQGYEITHLKYSAGVWFVVYSKGVDYTQSYLLKARDTDDLGQVVEEQHTKGYSLIDIE